MQNETIPELRIEQQDDGTLMLEQQNGFQDPDCINVHGLHVRHLAEQMGLIGKIDPDAQKTIATLTRRLLLLRDRIVTLHDFLLNHSDHKHADLSYERTYATATADIADELCHGLEDDEQPAAEQVRRPAPSKTAPTPAARATAQASLL